MEFLHAEIKHLYWHLEWNVLPGLLRTFPRFLLPELDNIPEPGPTCMVAIIFICTTTCAFSPFTIAHLDCVRFLVTVFLSYMFNSAIT